jgi:histidyl-tRNA synthetase
MRISILKGFADVYPPEVKIWQKIEDTAKGLFALYGYEELKLPVLEHTELFHRGIGGDTDIVEKEMYTFTDKGGRSITLRPEGTASAVRCYIENQLFNMPSPQRFYYYGPMFRYERPQRGRLRQFYQIGCEAFGVDHPALDAEVLVMIHNILTSLGLDSLQLELNSIGCEVCRPAYRIALIDFFKGRLSHLCADCNRRYGSNPLRIMDCKVPACIEQRQGAPVIKEYLCEDCAGHYQRLKTILQEMGLTYRENDTLVRGLDYYTKTTFEFTTDLLGAQKAVAAGGRYDRLVEEFGGPATPAVGFAMGMERLVSLLKDRVSLERPTFVFIASLGEPAEKASYRVAGQLRANGIAATVNFGHGSLKNQLRKADRLGVTHVLIIGDNELSRGIVNWKDLRNGKQGECTLEEFIKLVR